MSMLPQPLYDTVVLEVFLFSIHEASMKPPWNLD